MSLLQLEVALHGPRNAVPLGNCRFANDAAWHAQDERVAWDVHTFAADGARADDRSTPNPHAVEQNCAHRDETLVVDGRAVNDRPMSDGNAASDRRRNTIVDVNDRSVLDVTLVANDDAAGIATYHGHWPHGDAGAKHDVAAHQRVGMNERSGVDRRHNGRR